jgi:NADH-quinone oxidoreductase subunit K
VSAPLPALLPVLAVALDHVVLLAVALFAVGLLGVTCRRNILLMLLSVEIMLNAANLALVAFSRVHGSIDGQVFVFFTMTVAAAEVAVGLAIVIALFRLRRTTDVAQTTELAEADYGPVPPIRLEGEPPAHAHAHDEHAADEHAADEHGGEHDDGHGHGHGQHAAPAHGGHA